MFKLLCVPLHCSVDDTALYGLRHLLDVPPPLWVRTALYGNDDRAWLVLNGVVFYDIASQQQYEAIYGSPDNTVTLSALPGQTMVPAYDDIAGRGATDIVEFRNGQSCRYLSGPKATIIGSNTLQLYQVRCGDNFVDVSSVYLENGFVLPD